MFYSRHPSAISGQQEGSLDEHLFTDHLFADSQYCRDSEIPPTKGIYCYAVGKVSNRIISVNFRKKIPVG